DHTPPKGGKGGGHNLLIVDGDTLSPKRMARNKLLKKFSKSGRWVLALDVGSKHHSRALADATGFQALAQGKHTSRAFLFRQAVINGIPTMTMLDSERLTPGEPKAVGRKQRRKSKRAEAKRVANLIAQRIESTDDQLGQITGADQDAPQEGIPP